MSSLTGEIFVDGRPMSTEELKVLEENYRAVGKSLKKISETEYRTIQKLED